jgi:hypothetical protein
MYILIAGGTGFLGSHIISSFRKDGHSVTVLSRKVRESGDPGLRYAQWDGKHIPEDLGLFDIVINLSGAGIADKRWTKKYKAEIIESRVETSRAFVQFINQCNPAPQVFINASAVGYYGGNRAEEADEFSRSGRDFMAEVCKKWELAAAGANCRTLLLRFSVVLGKEGGALPIMARIYRLGLGARFASGMQGYSWIHVADVVKSIRFLIDQPEVSGPVNLAAPQIMTQIRFHRTLTKVMGKRDFWRIPKFALQWIFGERAILFWGGQKAIPRKLQTARYEFEYPSLLPALENLLKG